MKANELKDSLIRGVEPAYLIAGEDSHLRESSLTLLKNLAGEDMTEFNLSFIDGDKATVEQIIDAFSQVPFMSDRRVIVVKNWNPNLSDDDVKRLKSELASVTDSVLVFVYTGTPSTSVKKIATFVDCAKLDKNYVGDYVEKVCARENYTITSSAVAKLVTFTACDLAKSQNELKKLFAYCEDTRVIDESAVSNVVCKDLDFVIFALSNAVAQRNAKDAYEILEDAKGDNGKNLGMLTTLTTQFRRMLHVALNKNMNKKDVSEYLGITDFAVSKTLTLASKFNTTRIKNIVDRLEELEYEFKSGKIYSADQALFIGVTFALLS